jgi:hypothetical protein
MASDGSLRRGDDKSDRRRSALPRASFDVSSRVAEKDLLTYATKLGPVGLALRDVDEPTRARAAEAIRVAFDPYIENGAARFTEACWLVTARA